MQSTATSFCMQNAFRFIFLMWRSTWLKARWFRRFSFWFGWQVGMASSSGKAGYSYGKSEIIPFGVNKLGNFFLLRYTANISLENRKCPGEICLCTSALQLKIGIPNSNYPLHKLSTKFFSGDFLFSKLLRRLKKFISWQNGDGFSWIAILFNDISSY